MKFSASITACMLLLLIASCKSKEDPYVSENNIDAARNFIRSALDGKFREARSFMLEDSLNLNYLEVAERSYQRADNEVKEGYRTANILIHEVNEWNDSTSTVIYSNTFKNDHDTLKVILQNGTWLVDLKYLFEHGADPSWKKNIHKDTLP